MQNVGLFGPRDVDKNVFYVPFGPYDPADPRHSRLVTVSDDVFARLEHVISPLTHAEKLYTTVGDEARQILNSAVFRHLKVDSIPEDGRNVPAITDAPLTGPAGPSPAPLVPEQKEPSPSIRSARVPT
ncbi:MAG: hypothetical protein QM638_08065 [Nocardioides sp.]|uniref:hypothetical protein n=1 Tax=Nocardioides sp. TaxID=35761 RepID=UPI0039E6C88A